MSYVLMKMLESAPHRYDKGINILTLGKLEKYYNRIVEQIKDTDKVLDIGCGTGFLSIKAAMKGAQIIGFDINAEMLDIAKQRIKKMNYEDKIQFLEMGVAEMDKFEDDSFDVIMSGLCFSELSDDEIFYTLEESKRILKSNGILLLADEIRPTSIIKRILHLAIRIPLVIFTYLLTQTTSKAVKELEEKVQRKNFEIISLRKNKLGNFVELVAKNKKDD